MWNGIIDQSYIFLTPSRRYNTLIDIIFDVYCVRRFAFIDISSSNSNRSRYKKQVTFKYSSPQYLDLVIQTCYYNTTCHFTLLTTCDEISFGKSFGHLVKATISFQVYVGTYPDIQDFLI